MGAETIVICFRCREHMKPRQIGMADRTVWQCPACHRRTRDPGGLMDTVLDHFNNKKKLDG